MPVRINKVVGNYHVRYAENFYFGFFFQNPNNFAETDTPIDASWFVHERNTSQKSDKINGISHRETPGGIALDFDPIESSIRNHRPIAQNPAFARLFAFFTRAHKKRNLTKKPGPEVALFDGVPNSLIIYPIEFFTKRIPFRLLEILLKKELIGTSGGTALPLNRNCRQYK
jgi:hypothetical protein